MNIEKNFWSWFAVKQCHNKRFERREMRETMYYNDFIKAVEGKLLAMSEMKKTEWIRNKARVTKENERIAFLNSLSVKQDYCPIIYEEKEIEDFFRKIEEGEVYFECSSYEEYGDSYWASEYSYEYSDAFEIEKDLCRAFQIAESLLFQKKYKKASVLYERLCCTAFQTFDSKTEEWDELKLEDIVEHKLVNLNLKQIALNLMNAKYHAAKGVKRVTALYKYLSLGIGKNIKVEEIFTVGPEELKGIDLFMEDWITFLKNTEGDMAGEFLTVACKYQGGISRLYETAREASLMHPVLFEHVCKSLLDEQKESECEKIGLEAIRELHENLIIRGRIADLTIEAARKLGHEDVIRECYEVAFYSEATLDHYLRLFEMPDYQNIADRASKHANTLPEKPEWEANHKNQQLRVNSLSKDHKNVLRFFNGEFEYIYELCQRDSSTLGWSGMFKGFAVPLFILLLDKNKKLSIDGERLIDGIAFKKGFMELDKKRFVDQLLSWKEKVVLTNRQYEKYISWLKEEVDKRTDAVVGGGFRHSYYKAAILIAAFGEVLESNGMLHGRMVLIEHYKKMHPRKRAFKAEFELLI